MLRLPTRNPIVDILKRFQIIDYHRYVDVYNTHTTTINNTLEEFNKIHPRIKFTIGVNNKINFLIYPLQKPIMSYD
jgi:hypothetical protein